MEDAGIGKELIIDGGTEADSVDLLYCFVGYNGGGLSIDMGPGSDRLMFLDMLSYGPVFCDSGADADSLRMGSTILAEGNRLLGGLTLLTGDGDDDVVLFNGKSNGPFRVDMSDGNDSLDASVFRCLQGAVLDGGKGRDRLSLEFVRFAGIRPEIGRFETRRGGL